MAEVFEVLGETVVTVVEDADVVEIEIVDVVAVVDASPLNAPHNVFIGHDLPTTASQTYLWIQTGLGSGEDMTFWVEDGS